MLDDWERPATSPLEDITAAKELFKKITGVEPNSIAVSMKGYVKQKLFHDMAPQDGDSIPLWLVKHVLHIEPATHTLEVAHAVANGKRADEYWTDVLYAVKWKRQGHRELDGWNSARADLIAAWVEPPVEDPGTIEVELEPTCDPSYWLATRVLGFSDHELRVLCTVEDVEQPARGLLPLLGVALRILKDVRVKDEALQAYQRARYLLLRYYLDAHYYEPVP